MSADNVMLLAFAAECRAAGRPVAAAIDRSPAGWAHSSKPATCCCSGRSVGQTVEQTDGRHTITDLGRYHASSVNNMNMKTTCFFQLA